MWAINLVVIHAVKQNEAVREAAVVGVPDEGLGEKWWRGRIEKTVLGRF